MMTKWLQILIDDRENVIRENQIELERLKKAGRIYATASYKDGKYLYLIYPTQADGSRKREYIGADTVKIQHALHQIYNAQSYDNLMRETNYLKNTLKMVQNKLNDLIYTLERIAPLDLVTEALRQAPDLSPIP